MGGKLETIPGLAVAVLAGGGSRRMGRDKALLEVAGVRLLVHICRQLSPVAATLVVAAGTPDRQLPPLPGAARIVFDSVPDAGPLAGLSAVAAALPAGITRVFACGCDLPLIDGASVHALAAAHGDEAAVVPEIEGEPQLLAAVYSRALIERVPALFAAGERSLRALLAEPGVRRLDAAALARAGVEPRRLLGCNTPDELAAALAWQAEHEDPEGSR